ncbi:MAG: hypothetical protein ACE5HP_06420 [Gemmatimonadota bacterium]
MSQAPGTGSGGAGRVAGKLFSGTSARRLRFLGPVAALLLLLAVASHAGYHQLFGSFAWWDDEGYLMVSLRSFMRGLPLYDATYSQYGPAYYLLYSGLHELVGLPITHDVVRFMTLAEWLAISLGGLLIVRRLTGSWLFGGVAFTLVFLHVDRLSLEPGHPQGLTALLVTALLLLGTAERPGARRRPGFALGAVVGILLLTKINAGVLVLLAAAAAIAATGVPVGGRMDSSSGTGADAVGEGPLAVLRGSLAVVALLGLLGYAAAVALASGWSLRGLLLPAVATGGLAGVVAAGLVGSGVGGPRATGVHVGRSVRPSRGKVAGAGAFAAGSVLILALLTALILWQGTSAAGLAEGLLLRPLRLNQALYRPAALVPLVLPCALLPLPLALAAGRGRPGPVVVGRVLLLMLITAVVVGYAKPTTVPLGDAFQDRGYPALIVSVAPLLAWVLLFGQVGMSAGQGRGRAIRPPFGRRLLVLVAVSLPLTAYPIPGSQLAMGSFPLLLVGTVAASDFVRLDLPARTPAPSSGVGAAGLLLFLTLGSLMIRAIHVSLRYDTLVPLGLPGASRLRLPEAVVEEYRWVVSTLRSDCDTFVFGRQTRSSFYFWTRLEPPTAFNATRWEGLLNEREQRETIEALAGHERPCVVWGDPRRWEAAADRGRMAGPGRAAAARDRGPTGAAVRGRPVVPPAAPLAAHIRLRFEPAWERGRFQIWRHKDRNRKKTPPL